MAVNLSFLGGAGWQFFDNNGVPLSGGKLYTYQAGTTTPTPTYTSYTGLTPNANPIVLDSAGRPPEQIWVPPAQNIKFVLKTSADVDIWTKDNIPPFAQSSAANLDFIAAGTGAVTRTAQNKMRDIVSVKDFGAVGNGIANDTTAFQNAVNSGTSGVYVPSGSYVLTNEITVPDGVTIYGDGWGSFVEQTTMNKDVFIAGDSNTFHDLRLKVQDGNNTDFVICIHASQVNNLTVENCFLELGDLGCVGVYIDRVQNSSVRGNRIYGGKWTTGASYAASAADILLYSFGASERHVIDGNFCLSNNSQGIFVDALGFDGDIIVSNNVCVTLDPATCTLGGTWALVASGGVRRHGIVIGYNSSSVNGPRAVVTGNVCRNTRWAGIYKIGFASGPVLIQNNLCDLNGYAPGNSLAGGIYITQSGNEQIIGNYITNYQNVGNGTGGITINAPTVPTRPSTIIGNTIQGSLGYGIVLTTQAASVTVAENTLLDNVNVDIFVLPNPGEANNAGHDIRNNRIKRINATATAIYVDMQSSTQIMFVRGNRITGFDNTFANEFNAAIRVVQSFSYTRVIDNLINNFYYGVFCGGYYTAGRGSDFVYERNVILDCNTGFIVAATNNNQTIPLVDNRFINVTTQVTGSPLGFTAGRIVARLGDKFQWQTTAAPTVGSWDVGDTSVNSAPAIGQPKGWMCTLAGTPGTWVSTGNL